MLGMAADNGEELADSQIAKKC